MAFWPDTEPSKYDSNQKTAQVRISFWIPIIQVKMVQRCNSSSTDQETVRCAWRYWWWIQTFDTQILCADTYKFKHLAINSTTAAAAEARVNTALLVCHSSSRINGQMVQFGIPNWKNLKLNSSHWLHIGKRMKREIMCPPRDSLSEHMYIFVQCFLPIWSCFAIGFLQQCNVRCALGVLVH